MRTTWTCAVCVLAAVFPFATASAGLAAQAGDLRFAAGPENGTYSVIGEAIRDALRENAAGEEEAPDWTVDVLTTKGSLENIELLLDGRADLALVQADVFEGQTGPKRRQLVEDATYLFVLLEETLHIVHRTGIVGNTVSLRALADPRVARGNPGSGTRGTLDGLLTRFGYSSNGDEPADGDPAELLNDDVVDAACFVAAMPVAAVDELLGPTNYRLLSLERADIDAITSEFSGIYRAKTIAPDTYPHQDEVVRTVAVTAVLVARRDVPVDRVEALCSALLADVTGSESRLAAVNPALTYGDIEARTGSWTRTTDLVRHEGAIRAERQLSLWLRLRGSIPFQWIKLFATAVLVCCLLATAWFRPLRVRLMVRWSTHMIRLRRLLARAAPLRAPSAVLVMPLRIGSPLRGFLLNSESWKLVRIVCVLLLVWLAGAAFMYVFEADRNASFYSLEESLTSILVYLFSGLEDRAPQTIEGWAVSVLMLGAGIGLAAWLTGQFTAILIDVASRGGKAKLMSSRTRFSSSAGIPAPKTFSTICTTPSAAVR